MDRSRASLNSITVRGADVAGVVRLATEREIPGVALWRDTYVNQGARQAAASIAAAGLQVSSVCRGGMFPHADLAQRTSIWDDNRRAVDETRALNAACLVLVCGASPNGDLPMARTQIRDGLAQLADYAAAANVRLAVEPMHLMMVADRSAITSLAEANDLIDELGAWNLGIALDAYHVFWDAALEREVARAGERILSVQVCDWVTPIHGQLSSRGMPGEGSIDLVRFMELVDRTGYEGLVEVEVLSDRWWSRPHPEAADAALSGFLAI